jgi:hypothetical protein
MCDLLPEIFHVSYSYCTGLLMFYYKMWRSRPLSHSELYIWRSYFAWPNTGIILLILWGLHACNLFELIMLKQCLSFFCTKNKPYIIKWRQCNAACILSEDQTRPVITAQNAPHLQTHIIYIYIYIYIYVHTLHTYVRV